MRVREKRSVSTHTQREMADKVIGDLGGGDARDVGDGDDHLVGDGDDFGVGDDDE